MASRKRHFLEGEGKKPESKTRRRKSRRPKEGAPRRGQSSTLWARRPDELCALREGGRQGGTFPTCDHKLREREQSRRPSQRWWSAWRCHLQPLLFLACRARSRGRRAPLRAQLEGARTASFSFKEGASLVSLSPFPPSLVALPPARSPVLPFPPPCFPPRRQNLGGPRRDNRFGGR